jgi:transposase
MKKPKTAGKKTQGGLEIVYPNAAGLDIGSSEIMVAIPPDREGMTVRGFGTYTPDLIALADWLAEQGVTHVAMESTGVYWIPIYEVLEERRFEVIVVNARHIKHPPGRKSDVMDCQWIQQLHAYGMLRGSFRPEAEMGILRAYLRHRANLLEDRAKHIQYMGKALLQMNLQLGQVLSDLTGKTGLAILHAIVAGEHNPVALAELREGRCQHPKEDLIKALTGHYRKEHLFVLKQALEMYETFSQRLQECDQEIERLLEEIQPDLPDDFPPLPPNPKPNSNCKNAPNYDARALLYPLAGVDLIAIPGMNDTLLQIILSEVGLDLSRFPTVKHFCSWLGLAPHNAISGGRILYSHPLKNHNRAGQCFRLAARAVSRGRTAYSEFYRRIRARSGKKEANLATAHKLARTFYFMLTRGQPFLAPDLEAYQQAQREKDIRRLQYRAAKLGFSLQPVQAASLCYE